MSNAARAYAYPDRSRGQAYEPRPDVRVVPGQRNRQQADQSSTIITLARTIAVVSIVVAILCMARIALDSSTVQTALAANAVSSELAQARSEGTALEVKRGMLSESSRVKAEAEKLGLFAPVYSEAVYLPQDIVATDAEGNLSFAASALRTTGIDA